MIDLKAIVVQLKMKRRNIHADTNTHTHTHTHTHTFYVKQPINTARSYVSVIYISFF